MDTLKDLLSLHVLLCILGQCLHAPELLVSYGQKHKSSKKIKKAQDLSVSASAMR